jgi:hypothetical protein
VYLVCAFKKGFAHHQWSMAGAAGENLDEGLNNLAFLTIP